MLEDKKKHYYIPPIAEIVNVTELLSSPNIIICSNAADHNQGADAKQAQGLFDDNDYDDSQW